MNASSLAGLHVVTKPEPLTWDLSTEAVWSPSEGRCVRAFLPFRYFKTVHEVRGYLEEAQIRFDRYQSALAAAGQASPLQASVRVPDQVDVVHAIVRQIEACNQRAPAVPRLSVRHIGVLNVDDSSVPAVVLPGETAGSQKPVLAGARYDLGVIFDFGETGPPFREGGAGLPILNLFEFRVSILGDVANVQIGCLLLDDRAPRAYSMRDEGGQKAANGAPLPLLSPTRYSLRGLDGANLWPVLNMELGDHPDLEKVFEFMSLDGRPQLGQLVARLHASFDSSSIDEARFERYLAAVPVFWKWMRREYLR